MITLKRILRTVSQVVDQKPDYKKLGLNSVDSLNFVFKKSGNKTMRERLDKFLWRQQGRVTILQVIQMKPYEELVQWVLVGFIPPVWYIYNLTRILKIYEVIEKNFGYMKLTFSPKVGILMVEVVLDHSFKYQVCNHYEN